MARVSALEASHWRVKIGTRARRRCDNKTVKLALMSYLLLRCDAVRQLQVILSLLPICFLSLHGHRLTPAISFMSPFDDARGGAHGCAKKNITRLSRDEGRRTGLAGAAQRIKNATQIDCLPGR